MATGKEARHLAGHDPQRHSLLDRARGAELEEAGEQHRSRPDTDEERKQMQIEDDVVGVQGFSPVVA